MLKNIFLSTITDRYLLFLIAAFIATVTVYPSIVTLTLDFSRIPIASKADAEMLTKSGPAIALHYALYAVTLIAIAASVARAFIGPRLLPLILAAVSTVFWIVLTVVFYKKKFHLFWPLGISLIPHAIFFFWLYVFSAIDAQKQSVFKDAVSKRLNPLLVFFIVFILASGVSVIILTNALLAPAYGEAANADVIKTTNIKTLIAIIISHAVITLAAFVAYKKIFLKNSA